MTGVPLFPMDLPLVPVVIYHDGRPWGSKGLVDDGTDPSLREVYRCQVPAGANAEDVLETCFEEFNVGEESVVAKEYRARGLRSLSTGDVVLIDKVAYRCDSFGWSRVSAIVHES